MSTPQNRDLLYCVPVIMKTIPNKGRGIFYVGKDTLPKNKRIEICPVIPLTPEEHEANSETILNSYMFSWPKKGQKTKDINKWKSACICLGLGSLYNHSFTPNSVWKAFPDRLTIEMWSLKPIHPGEEIVHNYYWEKSVFETYGVQS